MAALTKRKQFDMFMQDRSQHALVWKQYVGRVINLQYLKENIGAYATPYHLSVLKGRLDGHY